MNYFITLLLVVILSGIVFYDLRYMKIPVYLLVPLIVVAGIRLLMDNPGRLAFSMFAINMLAIVMVLLLSCILLFILKGRLFNPVNVLIGSGDLLFLPVLCLSFSPVNFMAFFIGSSLLIVIIRLFYRFSGKFIPLAGLQAAFLVMALIFSELASVSSFNDQPILNLIL